MVKEILKETCIIVLIGVLIFYLLSKVIPYINRPIGLIVTFALVYIIFYIIKFIVFKKVVKSPKVA